MWAFVVFNICKKKRGRTDGEASELLITWTGTVARCSSNEVLFWLYPLTRAHNGFSVPAVALQNLWPCRWSSSHSWLICPLGNSYRVVFCGNALLLHLPNSTNPWLQTLPHQKMLRADIYACIKHVTHLLWKHEVVIKALYSIVKGYYCIVCFLICRKQKPVPCDRAGSFPILGHVLSRWSCGHKEPVKRASVK